MSAWVWENVSLYKRCGRERDSVADLEREQMAKTHARIRAGGVVARIVAHVSKPLQILGGQLHIACHESDQYRSSSQSHRAVGNSGP